MLLLQVVILAFVLSGKFLFYPFSTLQSHNLTCSRFMLISHGYSQITLIQTPLSVTRAVTKTARMACKITGVTFNSAFIHWYRQRPGAAPERILYIESGSANMDAGFDSKRFEAEKIVSTSTCNLKVHQLTREDAATYYCAYWDRTVLEIKRFGNGTKLTLLPHSDEQAGKVSYMCLIEDFYPDVIKVTWEDDNKNAEKNGVHEEIWPSDDNNSSYSMSSWLTVDKNSTKNYRCKYQHETNENGFATIESPGIYYIIKTSSIYI
uniref:Ig-like domain-containing protein n=1 Tax=Chelydra serpentina TaxID=8475 RepID=A0A8C3TIZ4_CHESE